MPIYIRVEITSNSTTLKVYNILKLDKDICKKWKFSGKNNKEYDSQVKGYVHTLLVNSVSKMQLPTSEKTTLGIVQSHVVFQIYLFSSNSISIEIMFSDTSKVRIL